MIVRFAPDERLREIQSAATVIEPLQQAEMATFAQKMRHPLFVLFVLFTYTEAKVCQIRLFVDFTDWLSECRPVVFATNIAKTIGMIFTYGHFAGHLCIFGVIVPPANTRTQRGWILFENWKKKQMFGIVDSYNNALFTQLSKYTHKVWGEFRDPWSSTAVQFETVFMHRSEWDWRNIRIFISNEKKIIFLKIFGFLLNESFFFNEIWFQFELNSTEDSDSKVVIVTHGIVFGRLRAWVAPYLMAHWLPANNIQLEQDDKQSLNNGKVDLIHIFCFINLIVSVLLCVCVCVLRFVPFVYNFGKMWNHKINRVCTANELQKEPFVHSQEPLKRNFFAVTDVCVSFCCSHQRRKREPVRLLYATIKFALVWWYKKREKKGRNETQDRQTTDVLYCSHRWRAKNEY